MAIEQCVRLNASKQRLAILTVAAALFGFASLWVALAGGYSAQGVLGIHDERVIGLVATTVFGILFLFCVVALVSNRLFLQLSADGFTVGSLFGARHHRWSEVKQFQVQWIRQMKLVTYDWAPLKNGNAASSVARSLSYKGRIGADYGMGVDELAALMEQWRRRYGQAA